MTDPRTGRARLRRLEGRRRRRREIGRLGSGSDYTAFLDHLGVPSFEAGLLGARERRHVPLRLRRHVQHGALPRPGLPRARGVGARRRHRPRCGSPTRTCCRSTTPTTRRRSRSYVEELQQVQAETPDAAQVDLSALLEAAQRVARRVRAPRGPRGRAARRRRHEVAQASRAIARINDALMRQERALTTSRGLPGPAVVPPPDLRARARDGLRGAVPAGHARRGRAGRRADGADLPRPAARLAARGARLAERGAAGSASVAVGRRAATPSPDTRAGSRSETTETFRNRATYFWLAICIRLPHVSSSTAVVTVGISSGSCVNRTPSARSRSYSALTSSTANDV